MDVYYAALFIMVVTHFYFFEVTSYFHCSITAINGCIMRALPNFNLQLGLKRRARHWKVIRYFAYLNDILDNFGGHTVYYYTRNNRIKILRTYIIIVNFHV